MERLLTTEDVAELLRIDPVTVRRLIMRGELPAYRIAGEYRFTSADVKQFVESQRVMVNFPNKNQFSDKFTNEARTVLALASEEALRYNHTRVGTEHLVLALLRDGEGIAARALNQSHIQEHEIRQRIETQHPEELDHPAVAGAPRDHLPDQGKYRAGCPRRRCFKLERDSLCAATGGSPALSRSAATTGQVWGL